MDLIDHVWISELNHLITAGLIPLLLTGRKLAGYPLRDALSIVIMDPYADPAQVLRQSCQGKFRQTWIHINRNAYIKGFEFGEFNYCLLKCMCISHAMETY